MASTMNNPRVSALAVAVEAGEACHEMRAAQCEQAVASQERRGQRWHALDRLLRGSFGVISPAYLFNSFPLISKRHDHGQYQPACSR